MEDDRGTVARAGVAALFGQLASPRCSTKTSTLPAAMSRTTPENCQGAEMPSMLAWRSRSCMPPRHGRDGPRRGVSGWGDPHESLKNPKTKSPRGCGALGTRPAGIEPATPSFVGSCSIQLSYGRTRVEEYTESCAAVKGPRAIRGFDPWVRSTGPIHRARNAISPVAPAPKATQRGRSRAATALAAS